MRCLLVLLVACSSSKPADPPKQEPKAEVKPEAKPEAKRASDWPVPDGWKSEDIPFPLGFAPDIKHEGVEELRFPKGFFDATSSEYWSYAFTWRTTDAAILDEKSLADELQRYFRGLIKAVDEKKQQIKDHDKIVATAKADGARFALTAHVYDAFGKGQAIDLAGWAERRACATGAVWVFVLAPEKTTIRAQLEELAAKAKCN